MKTTKILASVIAAMFIATSVAAQVDHERLVLMPVRVSTEDRALETTMEASLVEGLQGKYAVLYGDTVAVKAKEIFRRENLKTECNEERCLQDVVAAFQSELLATTMVVKKDNGYFITLTIQNLFDHLVVYTKSVSCESCTTFQVVDMLKTIGPKGVEVIREAKVEAPVKVYESKELFNMVRIEGQGWEITKHPVTNGEWADAAGGSCKVECSSSALVYWSQVLPFVELLNEKHQSKDHVYMIPYHSDQVYYNKFISSQTFAWDTNSFQLAVQAEHGGERHPLYLIRVPAKN
jgi:formylglycine-generating enzyme required for sulfatase activity